MYEDYTVESMNYTLTINIVQLFDSYFLFHVQCMNKKYASILCW